MDWYFGNLYYLALLLLVPLLGMAVFRFVKWKENRRNRFAEDKFQQELFEKNSRFSKVFFLLYSIAVAFLVLAIADVLKGTEEIETKQKMNNVVFLLDVSNSMNAEDVEINRLTEAKNIILNTLTKLKNDRIGVVIFAGDAVSIMPLTTDYTAADTYLGGIETDVMKIQGTDFLKAMQTASQKFKNIPKTARKVVLISDGEDNEGNESEAVKEAKDQGISVISVGVGTEEGAPVPAYLFGQLMGYKTDLNGETVISKRQTEALKKIANSTGGTYIDGNNLEEASKQIAEALENSASFSASLVKSQNGIHYYQYFLAVSMFFFLVIFLFNPKKDLNI
ncbi:MAG: VWA domain-containing protein [Bergeyella sp.]